VYKTPPDDTGREVPVRGRIPLQGLYALRVPNGGGEELLA
jgi:hypothetical protein